MKGQLSPQLRTWFTSYDSYHRTKGNKVTHYIGIPAIVITTLGLLSRVPLGDSFLTLGLLAWIGVSIWYVKLDRRLGAGFSLLLLALYLPSTFIPVAVCWTLFVIGWIAQFVGHYVYEKKSPAFFTNLQQTLIGPFWIFARVTRQYP